MSVTDMDRAGGVERAARALCLAMEHILSNALGVASDKKESIVTDSVLQEGREALAAMWKAFRAALSREPREDEKWYTGDGESFIVLPPSEVRRLRIEAAQSMRATPVVPLYAHPPAPAGEGKAEGRSGDGLPSVDGEFMNRSINDFVRACRVALRDEQEKIEPNTHVIALLCDAVRFTREHVRFVSTRVETPPATPAEREAAGVGEEGKGGTMEPEPVERELARHVYLAQGFRAEAGDFDVFYAGWIAATHVADATRSAAKSAETECLDRCGGVHFLKSDADGLVCATCGWRLDKGGATPDAGGVGEAKAAFDVERLAAIAFEAYSRELFHQGCATRLLSWPPDDPRRAERWRAAIRALDPRRGESGEAIKAMGGGE